MPEADAPTQEPVVQEPAAATPEPPKQPEPLHENPTIAKALEGLSEADRETLLTTGGKNTIAALRDEIKSLKANHAKELDSARSEIVQQIGKSVGLVEDESKDPEKISEELAAERFAAQRARVELAVYKTASAVNGDPAALLDSNGFLAKLETIDPADEEAVKAAIAEAVERNPRLGAEAVPQLPPPNPAFGTSGGGAPDLASQIDMAQKSGNTTEVIRLQNLKLPAAKP